MIKYSDLAMKILSFFTLPLIGWGFHLSTQVAVLENRVVSSETALLKMGSMHGQLLQVETHIVQLRSDVSVALGQQVAITQNAQVVAVLQEKLNAIVNNLNEIKDLLKNPVPRGR